MRRLEVPFELAIVASEIGSYKPGLCTGALSNARSVACRTCTSRPACSTTSRLRTRSGCPRSGSTAWESGRSRADPGARRPGEAARDSRRAGAGMSRLRARCPDCHTYTAVALGPGYECHACGREFAAGLVRVPRAWGEGGEAMAEAARLPLPYPEAAVVEEDSLGEQNLAIAIDLPERPLVLGGCCCAHIGAIEALAARNGRLALVWLDAHGDLNTPESSPSGNLWGDAAADAPRLGSRRSAGRDPARREEPRPARARVRRLDRPPHRSRASSSARWKAPRACTSRSTCDSLDPAEITPFMPEPGGLTARRGRGRPAAGARALARFSGPVSAALAPEPGNLEPLGRLCAALGL